MVIRTLPSGFTLIELLMAILVLLSLAGIGLPLYTVMSKRAKVQSTTALVASVASEIDSRGQRSLPAVDPLDPARALAYRLWDVNGDGLLDGRPDVDTDTPYPAPAIAAGYLGFLDTVQMAVNRRNANAKRQVVDGWGHPLRITFDPARTGSTWFGVWSCGPDGRSDAAMPATLADDLCSWKRSDR